MKCFPPAAMNSDVPERQTLAMMDQPNIVKVLNGGTADMRLAP
jgi:hypothetical protein